MASISFATRVHENNQLMKENKQLMKENTCTDENNKCIQERVLTCTICLEVFREPKILPCFHSFCKSCLWQHVVNTVKFLQFPCPLCRTNIRLPEGGVEDFQGNFYIQEFSELIKQGSPAKLQVKKDEKALVAPKDAKSVGEIRNGFTGADLICPTHINLQEWVVAYCQRCHVPICSRCKTREHAGHEWESLSVVVSKAHKELQALDKKVNYYQKILKNLADDRKAYTADFTSEVTTVSDQVKTCVEEIKAKVDNRSETLLELLDHLKVTETSKVEYHDTQVQRCTQELLEVKQSLNYMLKGSSILDMLVSRSHIREKVADVVKTIPGFIEKCRIVYDRKCQEGLTTKIEAAIGYLSCEKVGGGADDENLPTATTEADNSNPRLPSRPPLIHAGIRLLKRTDFRVRTNSAGIRFIVPVPNLGSLVGYDSNFRYMDLVDDRGIKIRHHEAVPNTTSALLLGQTNLVVCTSSPRQLSQRRLPGHTLITYRTSDLPVTPTGMAVRNPRELLVCGKDKSGTGTGLYIYSLETKQCSEVYRNNEQHILKAPCSALVTRHAEQEIFVVADNKKKSVFFFNEQGTLLHTFPTQRCSFSPEGMCRDLNGNIVVADKGNNSIVVLAPNGTFLQELIRGVNPRAVTFDMEGRLWLGGFDGLITVYDYLL